MGGGSGEGRGVGAGSLVVSGADVAVAVVESVLSCSQSGVSLWGNKSGKTLRSSLGSYLRQRLRLWLRTMTGLALLVS